MASTSDFINGDFSSLFNEQIPPGGRNELYRQRRVRIDYWFSKTSEAKPKVIELTEVTSISIQSGATTAIGLGPIAAVLQPWYFQPFKIEIQGRSYMGAFATNRLNVGVDVDVKKIMDMRQSINSDFLAGDVSNLKAAITYSDPNDASNLQVSQEFVGFVDDISISEDHGSPFVKDYVLKFTGEWRAHTEIKRGSTGRTADKKAPTMSTSVSESPSKIVPVE